MEICLQGLRDTIRVAGIFRMDSERQSYFSTLANYTNLTTLRSRFPKRTLNAARRCLPSPSLMENICATRGTMPFVAISSIARMEIIATSPGLVDGAFFDPWHLPGFLWQVLQVQGLRTSDPRGGKCGSMPKWRHCKSKSKFVMEHIDTEIIERIFLQSVKLSSSAIVDFVDALCNVAEREILADEHRQQQQQQHPQQQQHQPECFASKRSWKLQISTWNCALAWCGRGYGKSCRLCSKPLIPRESQRRHVRHR